MPACSHAETVLCCSECMRAVEPPAPTVLTTDEVDELLDEVRAARAERRFAQSCLHEQPGGPCAACAAVIASRTAPTPPSLGRVALVPPEDAATLAVLRAAIADPWVAQQCRGDADAARYVAEGHEERLAALGVGLDADRHREAARLWRARETLLRGVLRLIGEVER